MSLPARFALIDLETTGAHPLRDRITEIAILRVEGGELVQRWESLVNPGVPIPPTIQTVTGITDEMVAAAPDFAALADTVAALLDDCVFVAHNARFDYGFMKNAYAALGREFDAPVLCTVKLSRALYPDHHRHGLDALIERHGLVCSARHRAMGDTEVLWQFARLVADAFPAATLTRAVERAMKAPSRPPGLPEGAIEGLPDAPGVYLYFAEGEAPAGGSERPLYVARAASLRARVMEQFAAAARGGKEADLVRQVKRVEWLETAGELGAQLLEAELLRARRPSHNRIQHAGEAAFALRYIPNRKRPPILERVIVQGTDPQDWDALYGIFRSRKEQENLLREFALLYQLCPRRLGLESGTQGACSAHRAKRCAGVCDGRETPAQHDARLLGALAAARLKPWPWPGPAVAVERHGASGLTAHHLFDRWCYLGSTDDEAALAEIAAAPRSFDLDTYRMFARWLTTPAHAAAVRPLAA